MCTVIRLKRSISSIYDLTVDRDSKEFFQFKKKINIFICTQTKRNSSWGISNIFAAYFPFFSSSLSFRISFFSSPLLRAYLFANNSDHSFANYFFLFLYLIYLFSFHLLPNPFFLYKHKNEMKFQEIEMNEFLNGITLGKVMEGIVRMF